MTNNFEESRIFPISQTVGPRPWGQEDLLALVSQKFSLKRLKMNAGSMGGLQFHRLKDEVAFVLSGKLLIKFDLGDGILKERFVGAGGVIHFPPGLVHQEIAITDCEIIEASTPHFNDRVRVESHYGVDISEGLPSTELKDVELR